jgi:hypothetical protein
VTTRPTRAATDGRSYLDLQNLGRRLGRPTDELLQIFALEGFLARLADSLYADSLVLKGGVLLAAYGTRRPTRDVDLQARSLTNDMTAVLDIVRSVLLVERMDGLEFDTQNASAATIRDEDVYSGVRVSVDGRLSKAQLRFHVDVNVGDPIWPAPQQIELPLLLGGNLRLLGYPLAMIYAEKLLTAVDRGQANTRWRDFADVYLLLRRHDIKASELTGAIERVAAYRKVQLVPLAKALEGFADVGQPRWVVWRRKQRLEDRVPLVFGEVLRSVADFADPILGREFQRGTWNAQLGMWER